MNISMKIRPWSEGLIGAGRASFLPGGHAEWDVALDFFLGKQDAERGLAIDDPAGDDAVEAMCRAMDHLLNDVRAPDMAAVRLKIDLARARSADFLGLFEDHRAAIIADVRYLAGEAGLGRSTSFAIDTYLDLSDDPAWVVDLLDLAAGRTLSQALSHLDDSARLHPDRYPEHWCAVVCDIGGSVSANYPANGSRHLYVGCPMDGAEQERRHRLDALCSHMKGIGAMREEVADFLERSGQFTDNRPCDPRATTRALSAFLSAGFRVFIDPEGGLDTGGGLPKTWVSARSGGEIASILQAGRQFDRVRRRWRNEAQIKRAIRMLGEVRDNGFVVLAGKGH